MKPQRTLRHTNAISQILGTNPKRTLSSWSQAFGVKPNTLYNYVVRHGYSLEIFAHPWSRHHGLSRVFVRSPKPGQQSGSPGTITPAGCLRCLGWTDGDKIQWTVEGEKLIATKV